MSPVLHIVSGYLPVLSWAAFWALGGIWLAKGAFHIHEREQVICGLAIGMVLQGWLANLVSQVTPVPLAFWLSAGFVITAGLVSMLPLKNWRDLIPSIHIWQLLCLGIVILVMYLTGRGLAIDDDYQNLPVLSALAAGDIPPHFPLNPDVSFSYHYLLLLIGAQWMRIGQLYPWSALDLARSLTFALTVVLAGLWTWRLTFSRLAGLLGAGFMAFAGGTHWLLLFLPQNILSALSTNLTMIGSGLGSGSDLANALVRNWAMEGDGPIEYPFAFANGVNTPYVMTLGGFGVLGVLIIIILLLTHNRWRGWRGGLLSGAILAALALTHEIWFIQLSAGIVAAIFIGWILQRRKWHLTPVIKGWLIVILFAGFISLLQGGVLTGVTASLFERFTGVNTSGSNYFTVNFPLVWPPVLVSAQLGVLSLFNPYQLLTSLAEVGPVILVFPLVCIWGWKALRASRWMEAGLVLTGLLSLGSIFVLYQGSAGISATPRLFHAFLLTCKLLAVPLVWQVFRQRGDGWRSGVVSLAFITLLSGIVLFGITLIAIPRPVFSYFITLQDVQIENEWWNRLPPGSLVFDPSKNRAPTLLARPNRSSPSWYSTSLEWDSLVANPLPDALIAAGYDYIYFDNRYFDRLNPSAQQALRADCVVTLAVVEDYANNSRRLLDLTGCRK
jgi:hypothetical protein